MGNTPFRPVREIEDAVTRGDLRTTVAIAKDFARDRGHPIPLAVALQLLPLIARESLAEFDAWALRWLGRWVTETPAATIEQAAEVAACLADLPEEPSAFDSLREAAFA